MIRRNYLWNYLTFKTDSVPGITGCGVNFACSALVIAFQYAKHKGLEGIREQVYQLILKAEHMYKESGTGQQKLKMGCSAGERITAKVATGYYVGRCAA